MLLTGSRINQGFSLIVELLPTTLFFWLVLLVEITKLKIHGEQLGGSQDILLLGDLEAHVASVYHPLLLSDHSKIKTVFDLYYSL